MAEDYYELLGVSRGASEDEIKKAFRNRARDHHPDANPDDPSAEERFKEIGLAYETLRDPERRRRYDMYGPDSDRGGGGGQGGFGSFDDLFGAFFGGGDPFGRTSQRSSGGAMRGPDAQVRIEISLDQAHRGVSEVVEARMPVACEACDGSGCEIGTHPQACPTCNGSGEIRQVRRSILGQVMTARPCGPCGGVGSVIPSPCPACRGMGRVEQDCSIEVDIPPGISDGQGLRLSGRGPAGDRGGPAGDLFVAVRVRTHPKFERAGDDLLHTLHIPMTQGALGARLFVDTLEVPEEIAIPAGTQSGEMMRLTGRGMKSLRGRGRGDLLITVVVDVPEIQSEEQADLLRDFAAMRGEPVDPPDAGIFSRIKSAFRE